MKKNLFFPQSRQQKIKVFITIITTILSLHFSTFITNSANAGEAKLRVVASIKPIHSLVANIMQGIGEPGIIVNGTSSPHGYTLKPSQAKELQQADVVFWVGHSLETFLEKPLKTIASNATIVELADLNGITPIEEDHENDHESSHKEEHKDHDEHKGHDDHEKDKHDEHETDKHDEHEHGKNAHLWLNPDNAKIIVAAISDTLSKADPKNAALYSQNAQKTISKLDSLISEATTLTSSAKNKRFIVFHDAYKPFEQKFGLHSAGVISINPEAPASVASIRELQKTVIEANVVCIFSEPQFNPKTTKLVAEGSNVKLDILDPLGATLQNGPDLYFKLIQQMAKTFSNCLN